MVLDKKKVKYYGIIACRGMTCPKGGNISCEDCAEMTSAIQLANIIESLELKHTASELGTSGVDCEIVQKEFPELCEQWRQKGEIDGCRNCHLSVMKKCTITPLQKIIRGIKNERI